MTYFIFNSAGNYIATYQGELSVENIQVAIQNFGFYVEDSITPRLSLGLSMSKGH